MKLIGSTNFPFVMGYSKFIFVFARVLYWTLCWASSLQPTFSCFFLWGHFQYYSLLYRYISQVFN
jgi:hypothetical protein